MRAARARRRSRPFAGQLCLLPVLYGLDIETDTTTDGLDPRVARIVAVALSGAEGQLVFAGPEPLLLAALDSHLRHSPPGVIATWNGSAFDLPFLADRAAAARVRLGLELRPDPTIALRHPPLAGHAACYRARWYRHAHLDACRLYRSLRDDGSGCGLKRVARELGLAAREPDPARLHELPASAVWGYAASDALLTRLLAERAWLEAAPHLDITEPAE